MWKLPKRDYFLLLIVLALVGLLFWADFNSKEFGDLDRDHPIVGSLFSGFLVAVTGVLVFDTVRMHLEKKKWKAVSNVALLALSHDLTLVIDVFLWLGSGRTPRSQIGVRPLHKVKMVRLRLRKLLKPSFDSDYGHLAYENYNQMLVKLVEDKAWCEVAEAEVSRSKDEHRQSVIRLLPAMFLTADAVGILNRVVLVNHWMTALHSNLNYLAKPEVRRRRDRRDLEQAIGRDWMAFLAEAISLREDLWFMARPESLVGTNNRSVLHPRHRDKLNQRRPLNGESFRSKRIGKLIAIPVASTKLKVL